MAVKLYDYLDDKNQNEITKWLGNLPAQQLGKISAKLELLKRYGDTTLPGFVTPAVGSGTVKEIVIGGNRALRLLLCRGPFDFGRSSAKSKDHNEKRFTSSMWAAPEFTLLFGAEERDGKYVPRNAVQQAEIRRKIVLSNPNRREEHVHIRPRPD